MLADGTPFTRADLHEAINTVLTLIVIPAVYALIKGRGLSRSTSRAKVLPS